MAWSRDGIARRAAREVGDDWTSLGAGLPTRVTEHLPEGFVARLHENGAIRVGGAHLSYFSSADSFDMVRGGRVETCILGAMQVSANGDLANWIVPGRRVVGMGGAMDLVAHAKRVIILMEHVEKGGAPKLVSRCTLPLTGASVVDMLITDLAVMKVDRGRSPLKLVELAPGVTVEEVRAKSEAHFSVQLQ